MWKTLSKSDAAKLMISWKMDQVPSHNCENNMMELRKRLLVSDLKVKNYLSENNLKKRQDYLYDMKFGLELYQILMQEYQFTKRQASNDEIWIYLSVNVIPDIVYRRWGLVESRYYKQSRRIWLRTLWWYIHLSWAGNKEETFNRLKNFTTDEIVQMVERSGPRGYRIDLTREIMKQFSNAYEQSNRNLFRRIMKLNTARLKVIEPRLTEGGVSNYVKELIDYFDYKEETNKRKVRFTTSN